jgi:aspartate 1-decarboxylase
MKRFMVVGNGPFFIWDKKNGCRIKMYMIRANAERQAKNMNRQVKK